MRGTDSVYLTTVIKMVTNYNHFQLLSHLQEVIVFLVKSPPYWMLLIAGSIRNISGYIRPRGMHGCQRSLSESMM